MCSHRFCVVNIHKIFIVFIVSNATRSSHTASSRHVQFATAGKAIKSCAQPCSFRAKEVFFLASRAKAQEYNEKKVRVAWRQCNTRDTVEDDHRQAQREVLRRPKIRIIKILLRRVVSEIKLKRTDTTLVLSQKAKRAKEKKKKGFKCREPGEV